MLYNADFDIVEANTGTKIVEDKINVIQTLNTDKFVIQENGFFEVFVNNEAQTPVFFDNLVVSHTPSQILEVNTYYPFGMLMQGSDMTFQSAIKDEWNGYKYSGKELETALNLEWGFHENRMLDYTLGRWWVPDPLAEKYYPWSSYNYALNNPVRFIDPDGTVAGDFVDEDMKYLGNDGNADGKVYLVKDKGERKAIAATEKAGGATNSNSISSAEELPSANVRAEMGAVVNRSNSANTGRTDAFKGDDNEGGFHEEGGIYGKDRDGQPQAVPAKPGPKTEPTYGSMATVNVEHRADPNSPLIVREGSYHVHPRGVRTPSVNTIGGQTRSFNQSPTKPDDFNVAGNYPGNSYVLGAGNNTVTIHNGTGTVSVIKNLNKFVTYRAK